MPTGTSEPASYCVRSCSASTPQSGGYSTAPAPSSSSYGASASIAPSGVRWSSS